MRTKIETRKRQNINEEIYLKFLQWSAMWWIKEANTISIYKPNKLI